MIDSHAHLNDEKFNYDRDDLIKNLKQNGVDYIYNIGADLKSSEESVELANKYDNISAVIGVHPEAADEYNEDVEKKLIELSKNKKVRAIGEIGLDYHFEDSPSQEIQKKVFIKQIELANSLNLPIVIHSRDSAGDTFNILKENHEKFPNLKVLLHCYSQSFELMQEYVKMGFFIGLGGVVTFKNAINAKKIATEIPIDNLILETDCPYMAPVPMRGKRNEPMFIKHTAEYIANLKKISFEELIKNTDFNTKRFYND